MSFLCWCYLLFHVNIHAIMVNVMILFLSILMFMVLLLLFMSLTPYMFCYANTCFMVLYLYLIVVY